MTSSNNKTDQYKLSDNIDSPEDKKKMEEEINKVNMPDVTDIPGQEHIMPMPRGKMADTTISSADEEGADVYNDNIDHKIIEQEDSNVSKEERDLLASVNDMRGDDQNLREAALDSTDNAGTPLNEGSFDKDISPDDLDVPGAMLDDKKERIGAEDEENNEYSLGGDGNPGQDGSPRSQF